jgi:hypothetical protein
VRTRLHRGLGPRAVQPQKAGHLYVSVLDNAGSAPMEIAELNSATAAEIAKTVTPDTLTIYFGFRPTIA